MKVACLFFIRKHTTFTRRYVSVYISAIQNSHRSDHWFSNCAAKRQTFAKGKYSSDVFRIFSIQNIKVYTRLWSWVITLGLLCCWAWPSAKIKNIGVVICPASCCTSKPPLTAVKIFALVMTTIRLCSVHLRLCLSALVDIFCHRRSFIDGQLRFVDLYASLRSVIRAAHQAASAWLRCPLH